ncbi:MAG: hypothetical protein IJT44_00990 [Clostridia bacterium]|nr:hypothetical protein [Clostridia bacterium]
MKKLKRHIIAQCVLLSFLFILLSAVILVADCIFAKTLVDRVITRIAFPVVRGERIFATVVLTVLLAAFWAAVVRAYNDKKETLEKGDFFVMLAEMLPFLYLPVRGVITCVSCKPSLAADALSASFVTLIYLCFHSTFYAHYNICKMKCRYIANRKHPLADAQLYRICLCVKEPMEVRVAAAKLIRDVLIQAELLQNVSTVWHIRAAVLEHYADLSVVADSALHDRSPRVRRVCLLRTDDQAVLGEAAQNDRDEQNQTVAIGKLSDPEILMQILRQPVDRVRIAAYTAACNRLKALGAAEYYASLQSVVDEYAAKPEDRSARERLLVLFQAFRSDLSFPNALYDESEGEDEEPCDNSDEAAKLSFWLKRFFKTGRRRKAVERSGN